MRMLFGAVLLVIVLLVGLWLAVSLYAKSQYDSLLKKERATTFTVAAMNEEKKTLLTALEHGWSCLRDSTNTEISQLLSRLGLAPSVSNVVEVLHAPLPEFHWWSISQSVSQYQQAAMIGFMKLAYSNHGSPQTFYVSDDGHLAVLLCSSNVVIVFQDHTSGVREAHYFSK